MKSDYCNISTGVIAPFHFNVGFAGINVLNAEYLDIFWNICCTLSGRSWNFPGGDFTVLKMAGSRGMVPCLNHWYTLHEYYMRFKLQFCDRDLSPCPWINRTTSFYAFHLGLSPLSPLCQTLSLPLPRFLPVSNSLSLSLTACQSLSFTHLSLSLAPPSYPSLYLSHSTHFPPPTRRSGVTFIWSAVTPD